MVRRYQAAEGGHVVGVRTRPNKSTDICGQFTRRHPRSPFYHPGYCMSYGVSIVSIDSDCDYAY